MSSQCHDCKLLNDEKKALLEEIQELSEYIDILKDKNRKLKSEVLSLVEKYCYHYVYDSESD